MTIVVDYAEAIDKAGGSVDLAKELLGMLLQELPTFREQLSQAIEHTDLQAMWDHAHKLHGSTAYCGVPLLRAAASEMETAVKGQELSAIKNRFSSLNQAIEQLIAQGPAHLKEAW